MTTEKHEIEAMKCQYLEAGGEIRVFPVGMSATVHGIEYALLSIGYRVKKYQGRMTIWKDGGEQPAIKVRRKGFAYAADKIFAAHGMRTVGARDEQ